MTIESWTIEPCTSARLEDWIRLRQLLWPQAEDEHRREALGALANPDAASFVACDQQGNAVGFAEVTLRHDYVNGCATSPVGFLEGIYVRESHRRRGMARALCHAAEGWVKAQGCSEFASDAWLDNAASHRMHTALGFSETERVVYFHKALR